MTATEKQNKFLHLKSRRQSIIMHNAWFRLCNDVIIVSEGVSAGKRHLIKFALNGFGKEKIESDY
jgi:molybdopterin biosynthesis enzyme